MASRKKADEEKLRRRRWARFRFRSLVHLVMCNRYWLSEIEDQELGDNVRRNVAIIFGRKITKSVLSIVEKSILSLRPVERTKRQKEVLNAVFRKLKCFERFSPKIREELAQCAYYRYYEPGRLLLREGHEAHSVYFLLDGEIIVSRLQWDNVYKRYEDIPCGSRAQYEMFGEMAFLYDCTRTASCVTKMNCELLCVDREDFEQLLKPTLVAQWDQIRIALQRFEYFSKWNENQIRECCLLAQVHSYEPQEKISFENSNNSHYAYVVLNGHCMMLQCIQMIHEGGKNYRLAPVRSSNDAEHNQNLIHRFIDAGTLCCGAVFNLGERSIHRSIVARMQVQCMLIPRYWLFLQPQNTANIWQRIKMYMDATVPSREQLFENFLRDQNWERYRDRMTANCVALNPRHIWTGVRDVPIICRVEKNG